MKAVTTVRQLLVLVVLMTLVLGARAAGQPSPESGIWWNADQPGRGFVIEVQDQYIMISSYAYDPDGEAVFFLASGPLTSSTYFSGTVLRTANGQCFNCAYKPPTQTAVGAVTINFTSPWSANITWLGESIQIKRFDVVGYLNVVPDVLLGDWALVDGLPATSGERLSFRSVGMEGQYRTVYGTRTLTSDTVSAAWQADVKQLWILLDSSPAYQEVWRFEYSGFSRLFGEHSVFLKGQLPSVWETSVGHRINFQDGLKWVMGGRTSSLSSSNQSGIERDELKRKQAEAIARSAPATGIGAEEAKMVRFLEAQIAARRGSVPSAASMK